VTRIAVDLNVRVRGDLTYSGLEDLEGDLPLDGMVEVYEPESDIVGVGRVVDIDEDARLIYLAVDWASLRPRTLPGNAVFISSVRTYSGVGTVEVVNRALTAARLVTAVPTQVAI